MRKRNVFYSFIFLGTIFFIFRHWFLNSFIIGGDWPYYYDEFLKSISIVPIIWAPWQGNGIGGINPLLGLHVFSSLLIVPFVGWIGLSWVVVYKVGWFGLFIALSVYGSKKLWEVAESREQIAENREQRAGGFPWWVVASLVYTTNTYILMVTGGGQMGVAIAYALAPFVLASFIRLINFSLFSFPNSKQIQNSIIAGLILGVQLMIDPRIAYVTMVGVGLYVIANSKWQIANDIFTLVVPLVIAALLNAFWIVPMVMMRSNPIGDLGSAYTSIDSIKFFSFADFSHALSLLHPNWPENVFGKTSFLQPEFLVLPILGFGSLLWIGHKTINNKQQKRLLFTAYGLFFSLLALAGAFLAKGAQEPFGIVYQWMFTHIPGFVMFRDPTKWYVLIALGYSILIPFTLKYLGELFSSQKFVVHSKVKNISPYAVYCLLPTVFLVFWLFSIRPAVLGQLGGTFVRHTVPQEYGELEQFLQVQPNFARTLWVPRQQRFSYGTLDHMPVEAEPLFGATTAAELKTKLDEPTSKEILADLGIGYVMIPYDSLGELFLTDRKYDEKKRKEYQSVLDGVGWLTKIRDGNLTVYQIPQHKDLFWLSTNEAIMYKRLRPDQYAVSFTVGTSATIYFSQTYHPDWVLRVGNTRITSDRSPQGLNSFSVSIPGTYEGMVEFEPQKYVTWGMAIFLLTVLGVLLFFVASKERQVPV